jgi:hypothetical protein
MSTSRDNSRKIQFVGKTVLMKQIQRTVAFRAYNSVLSSGSSKGGRALQSKAHALYFGYPKDEDSLGLAQQFVRGMNAFSPLFDREENIAERTTTKIFHCSPDNIVVSTNPKDKGINMAVLSSKGMNNRVQLTARGVWDFGNREKW